MTAMAITKVSFTHDEWYRGKMSPQAELIMTGTAGTYATGGDIITDLDLYFTAVHGVDLIDSTISGETAPGLYSVGFDDTDPAAAKLVCYIEDSGSGVNGEVADMTDLSGVTMRLRIKGTVLAGYGA